MTVETLATTESPRTFPNRHGGARPGSGRKPKPRNPTLLERAYTLLDEATIPAVNAIVLLTKSRNPMVRLHAAKAILAKTIPDLTKDVTTRQPITINIVYGHASPLVQIARPLEPSTP